MLYQLSYSRDQKKLSAMQENRIGLFAEKQAARDVRKPSLVLKQVKKGVFGLAGRGHFGQRPRSSSH